MPTTLADVKLKEQVEYQKTQLTNMGDYINL